MGRSIPRDDNGFFSKAASIHEKCLERAVAWEVDAREMEKFTVLFESAREAYLAHLNVMLRNRVTKARKDVTFRALLEFLRLFVKTLEGNLRVSDSELNAMGLQPRRRAAKEPLTWPGEAPVLSVHVMPGGLARVSASIPGLGHPTRTLRRKEYRGIVARYRVGTSQEWVETYCTRLRVVLSPGQEHVGECCTIAAAWLNPRLERGPWSNEMTVLLY